MSSLLAERLRAARRKFFVGRSPEQALFQEAIRAETLPFLVLHIYGPGGIGKTTLLRTFADLCAESGVLAISLDARNVDPSPTAFILALQQALNLPPEQPPFEHLLSLRQRITLFVDTYETLAPLDEWLRLEFLPNLPADMLVVLAGRQPPGPAWRADPGWQALVQLLPLRNLDPDESRSLLNRRQVPPDQHREVLNFTHGHPLALSLVADVFAQRPNFKFIPVDTPDIVKALLEHLLQKVPGAEHRMALEACALVSVMTEPLLAAMLAETQVHELFEWLRSLSFIDFRRDGLFPHDLAREALVADLRWRNPDWFGELKDRARAFYAARLRQTGGETQQRVMFDYIYLHRENPVVRPVFEWQMSGGAMTDTYRPPDLPALVAMVTRHEGSQAGELAASWINRFPQATLVIRDDKGVPAGMLLTLPLNDLSPADLASDPACAAARRHLDNHAPLRPTERASLFRFWLAADTYQQVSPIQSLIFIQMVLHYLTTPALAFTFIPCAEPDFWLAVFAYADLMRLSEADFKLDGRVYGVYGHDWRLRPPLAWLDLLADRENNLAPEPPAPPAAAQLVVLSQHDFAEAVREALRAYTGQDAWRTNPLLRSRLVVNESGGSPERLMPTLGALLDQAIASLHATPKSEKFYRVLELTYLHPAPTQEIAAERLDLPFSTYRRHLKEGLERVTAWLWVREISHLDK